jgi:hypothetical protein
MTSAVVIPDCRTPSQMLRALADNTDPEFIIAVVRNCLRRQDRNLRAAAAWIAKQESRYPNAGLKDVAGHLWFLVDCPADAIVARVELMQKLDLRRIADLMDASTEPPPGGGWSEAVPGNAWSEAPPERFEPDHIAYDEETD